MGVAKTLEINTTERRRALIVNLMMKVASSFDYWGSLAALSRAMKPEFIVEYPPKKTASFTTIVCSMSALISFPKTESDVPASNLNSKLTYLLLERKKTLR